MEKKSTGDKKAKDTASQPQSVAVYQTTLVTQLAPNLSYHGSGYKKSRKRHVSKISTIR